MLTDDASPDLELAEKSPSVDKGALTTETAPMGGRNGATTQPEAKAKTPATRAIFLILIIPFLYFDSEQ
jgi:hypothetical protein